MGKLKKLIKKQGFTLVELIIVIAIIAVLAVAAFMMLTKWLGKSRDSRRIADLGTIKKALEITYSDTDNGLNMYPKPTTNNLVQDSDTNDMWNLGVFGLDTIGNMDNMQKAPQDPSFQTYYKYAVTLNQKEFQVGTMLENGSEVSFVANAFAAGETALIDGNYDGYVSYPTAGGVRILKTPSLLLYSGASLSSLTGNTANFMVTGESEGEIITLKNIEVTDSTTDTEIASALAISENEAKIIMKQELGTNSSESSDSPSCADGYTGDDCSQKIIPTSPEECTVAGQIGEASSSYSSCNTNDIIVCSGNGSGIIIAACNYGTNIAGTTTDSYGGYVQFGRSNTSFTQLDYSHDWKSPGGTDAGSANDWGVYNSTSATATYLNSNSTNKSKMLGPCASGYHVPTDKEWSDLYTAGGWETDWSGMLSDLKLPLAGNRSAVNGTIYSQGINGNYWTASPRDEWGVRWRFELNSGVYSGYTSNGNLRNSGFSVRCFKN